MQVAVLVKQLPDYLLTKVYESCWAHGVLIASEICEKGGVAEYRALNVTNLEDMQAIVEFAKNKFGYLDVVVNNAGIAVANTVRT